MSSHVRQRLAKIGAEDLDEQQRAVYEKIAHGPRAINSPFPLSDAEGHLNGPFGMMVSVPRLGEPLQALGAAVRFSTGLTDRMRETAILQVAQALRSDFEWWAHEKVARLAGITDDELAMIRAGELFGRDEHERASQEAVSLLLNPGTLSDAEFERVHAVLGEQTLIELSIVMGYYWTLSRMMHLFEIGIPHPQK
jgi:4-carboxymuconolactone decarboxylase